VRRSSLEPFRAKYGHKQLTALPKEFVVALRYSMAPNVARWWLAAFRHFIQ
jgi:hypothetical protein